ncbi:hypothetical protein RFI_15867 [Reticulomyxa filosa]|uniref:DEP domain-containing protein n=1 Tax=Reticulomyxa filosa TaxID=46433 RepID=X6N7Q9_RETFI|nr:hypothetical protein RFI_15867 [Reticulomyxa filosa]|eukprot:ETO21337.1 hypothetical protein RFI_15867 [Reticulomyxa filosa]
MNTHSNERHPSATPDLSRTETDSIQSSYTAGALINATEEHMGVRVSNDGSQVVEANKLTDKDEKEEIGRLEKKLSVMKEEEEEEDGHNDDNNEDNDNDDNDDNNDNNDNNDDGDNEDNGDDHNGNIHGHDTMHSSSVSNSNSKDHHHYQNSSTSITTTTSAIHSSNNKNHQENGHGTKLSVPRYEDGVDDETEKSNAHGLPSDDEKELIETQALVNKRNDTNKFPVIKKIDLAKIVLQMKREIPLVKKHGSFHLWTVTECFSAIDAVRWMLKNASITRCETETDAVELGNLLIKQNIIKPLHSHKHFKTRQKDYYSFVLSLYKKTSPLHHIYIQLKKKK